MKQNSKTASEIGGLKEKLNEVYNDVKEQSIKIDNIVSEIHKTQISMAEVNANLTNHLHEHQSNLNKLLAITGVVATIISGAIGLLIKFYIR